MITGNQLVLLRTIRKFDQAALARMLGISQQYISRLERLGDKQLPDYWTDKIIKALNCNEAELQKIKDMFIPPPRTHFKVITT